MLFKKNLLAIVLSGCALTANAGTTSADFKVTMKITSACSISTLPGTLDLGTAVSEATPITNTSSTTFKVNCSRDTPFWVGMLPSSANGGTAYGTGFMVGAIAGNTDKVPYTLYSDSAATVPWGSAQNSGGMSGVGAGMAANETILFVAYAKAVKADFEPDTYSDTVTLVVNY